MSKEVAEEYLSSLADLTVNYKPLILMLTMLADENSEHAPAIVQAIESHIEKVPPAVKLPILYLIDSIIKNISQVYLPLFSQKIVQIFVSVFEKVDDATRAKMFKLRETWTDVFPSRMLFALDVRLKEIDIEWPLSAPPPATIHFNPRFLGNNTSKAPEVSSTVTTPIMTAATTAGGTTTTPALTGAVIDQFLKHHQILCGLKQEKLELELIQKVMLEQQQKQLQEEGGSSAPSNAVRPSISEEAAKLLSQKAIVKPKAVVMPPSTATASKPSVLPTPVNVTTKTKIAPANTRLIEAAKSRDPRIARQQQLQQVKAPIEVTLKEQEIYNRQLAMLKTPVVGQVAGLPVQRVLSESNVKSHITIDVDSNRSREKTDLKSKKHSKESTKSESSRSRSKQSSPKDAKSSPTKSSKSSASASKSTKSSSPKSQKRSSSRPERSRTPPKSERNSSSSSGRVDSPKSKSSKHSSSKHSRLDSPKLSSKKSSSKSPRSSSPKNARSSSSSKSFNSPPKTNPPLHSVDSIYSESDTSEKLHKKSKKLNKEDSENSMKNPEFTVKTPQVSSVIDTSLLKVGRDNLSITSTAESVSPVLYEGENMETTVTVNENAESSNKDLQALVGAIVNQKIKDNLECETENNANKSDVKKQVKLNRDENQSDSKKGRKFVMDLELIESSPSPEPPPPPIISLEDEASLGKKDVEVTEISDDEKLCKKELMSFKGLKGTSKGRNYIRRNREMSVSPQNEVTGDVDLRKVGPPEKQPRLLFNEEITTDIEKSLVNISGKDMDLRQLTIGNSSPSKRRLSTDGPEEEPPKKKKTGVFDELFEDIDLRLMTITNLKQPTERMLSPPPPPVISNGLSTSQVAAPVPLNVESSKSSSGDIETLSSQEQDDEKTDDTDLNKVRSRKSWADVKIKKEPEVKPMPLSSQLELELTPRKEESFSHFEATEREDKSPFRDRASPRGALDRLGRPLLYNKLPNDPRARRESLGVLDGRDTDMRRLGGLMERDLEMDINVNMIVAEAEEQLRNGTMTVQQYNEIVKQVIHVNEVQKLREAQKKDRQENRRIHHHRGRRSPPGRFGPSNRNSPPYRHDDDRRDRRPFNDIDERMQLSWRTMQRPEINSGFGRSSYNSGGNRNQFDVPPIDPRNFDDRPIKSDIWDDERPRFRRPPHLDKLEALENRPRDVMCTERTHDCVDVPPADPKALEMISKDPMKSINIDGTPRDIRFYGDTAVVMLSWNDPKEISFEDGVRRVAVGDLSIVCALNAPYIMFRLNGNAHRIRLGAPTRELYIDGEFYEAHFGGPPVQVQLDGLTYLVQVEGPPPQVKIGEKRTDLICGRVNMIVDATAMLPLYLDAKPQRFDLRSRPYVFRLVNSLKTLLVNEVPVDIQFGGGCRQICGYGNLHFLRLSVLPTGVVPGSAQISNMESIGVAVDNSLTMPTEPRNVNTLHQPLSATVEGSSTNERKLFESPSEQVVSNRIQGGGPLDILTSLMSGTSVPEQPAGYNYKVENRDQPTQPAPTLSAESDTSTSTQPSEIPILGANININDLFQRLVATGIVQTTTGVVTNQPPEVETPIKPIDINSPNSLREKQPAIINLLYSGIQCSSCGVRFLAEETVKYSRHLDWHFRQNRREKDAARKGQSRKWYYDVSDWIQFEEIEDLEERAQSWFETEATNQTEENVEQEEVKSVLAPPGDEVVLCDLCRDKFETFYNEEKEEWHLKPCILIEEKYYHPMCYQDLVNAPDESFVVDKSMLVGVKEEPSPSEDKIEIDDVEDGEDGNDSYEKLHKDENDMETHEISSSKEESSDPFIKDIKEENDCDKETIEDVKGVIENLICCIEHNEEIERLKAVELAKLSAEEDELQVIENVKIEPKKNIIDVDLIEKIDDDDDDEEVFYHRRTPSPITLIPTAKIKQEPVDEMESAVAVVDQTYTNVVSSIDGNVEMIDAPPLAPAPTSKIKITFSKPIATEQPSEKPQTPVESETRVEEEPEPLPLKPKKPRIAEQEMTIYPTSVKGTEVSGLCSIM